FGLLLVPALLREFGAGVERDTFFTRIGVCSLLMLVPTTLMGASFPLLLKHLVRDVRAIGGAVGRALAVNTVGSVAGSLSCRFLLLPVIGLERALVGLSIGNAALGAGAALAQRGGRFASALAGPIVAAAGIALVSVIGPFALPLDAVKNNLHSDQE